MKVFSVRGHGNYGAGLVIVAANTMSEAKNLAQAQEKSPWNINYLRGDVDVLSVEYKGNSPAVLDHFEYGE